MVTLGGVAGAPASAGAATPPTTDGSATTKVTRPAAPATTAPGSGGPPVADNDASGAEAAALAEEIRNQGIKAERLSEQVNAAQIRVEEISAQLQEAERAGKAAGDALHQATSTLARQAVAAYIHGGRPNLTYVAGDTVDDKSLIQGYASVVAGTEQQAVATYRAVRQRQTDQEKVLSVARDSAAAAVERLGADRAAAEAAAAAEQQILDRIAARPALAVMVEGAQDAQYQATAATVQARFGGAGASAVAPATPSADPPNRPASSAPVAAGPGLPTTRGSAPPAPGPGPIDAVVPARTSSPTPEAVLDPVPSAPARPPAGRPAPPAPPSGVSAAIAYAYAQIGKPYQWGAAGPNSFDCSGLVMEAYQAAGIEFDHLAQDQYWATSRVAISALQAGDLVFFGTPANISHVGIYVGSGQMVDAPHSGSVVRVEGIYWGDLLSGGRVR